MITISGLCVKNVIMELGSWITNVIKVSKSRINQVIMVSQGQQVIISLKSNVTHVIMVLA